MPALNEEQLYAIHIIASTSFGTSTSIDFYVKVVNAKGNQVCVPNSPEH